MRSLVSGTEPVLAEQADAGTMAAPGCAHVSLVPTQLQRLLLQVGAHGPTPLAGFSSVLLGGAATPAPALLEAAPGRGCAGGDDLRHDARPAAAACTACRWTACRPRSADDGRIWISGPVLFSGYPGGPRAFADGWFRTGDLGLLDAGGRLTVRGRADDVINTGGHKVVPGEVAAALAELPGRPEAAVVGASPTRNGANGSSRWWCLSRIRPTRRPWNCSVGMCASGCRVTLFPAGS